MSGDWAKVENVNVNNAIVEKLREEFIFSTILFWQRAAMGALELVDCHRYHRWEKDLRSCSDAVPCNGNCPATQELGDDLTSLSGGCGLTDQRHRYLTEPNTEGGAKSWQSVPCRQYRSHAGA